jgi:gamma-glutamyltranspeptidase/glutathione hydrolase
MSLAMVCRDCFGSSDYGHVNKAMYDNLGNLVLLLGSSGGPKIITVVLQMILNYAFIGMPLFESMSAPRIEDQLLHHGSVSTNVKQSTLPQGPDIMLLSQMCAALEKRGHGLIETDYLGMMQAVGG